jgi:hypothetical protein
MTRTCRTMEDVDGPMIAESIYRELIQDHEGLLDPGDIPCASDATYRKLAFEKAGKLYSVTFIHVDDTSKAQATIQK